MCLTCPATPLLPTLMCLQHPTTPLPHQHSQTLPNTQAKHPFCKTETQIQKMIMKLTRLERITLRRLSLLESHTLPLRHSSKIPSQHCWGGGRKFSRPPTRTFIRRSLFCLMTLLMIIDLNRAVLGFRIMYVGNRRG